MDPPPPPPPPPPPLLTSSSSPTISSCLIPSLPDDRAILCIARVPRSRHPFLASVSRAWRAFLRSPLIFSVRLQLGVSEQFLFINLILPTRESHWFLLDRPHWDYSPPLIPLPAPPLFSAYGCTVAALGHSLFLLGGSVDDCTPSNVVQIYDARFNCWRIGPPMLAPRWHAAAGVISGRIYVFGSFRHMNNEDWAEEFDPEKQRWRRISTPQEVQMLWFRRCAVIRGKLFVMENSNFVIFDPAVVASEVQEMQEKAWSLMAYWPKFGTACSVGALGEVLYSYDDEKKIQWYDFTKAEWKRVEGIDERLPGFLHWVKLANLGDLLCIVWGGRKGNQMEVFSAGVSVTKTDNGSIQGSVGWSKTFVLPFPERTFISDCISLEF